MSIDGSTVLNRPIEVIFDCIASVSFIQRVTTTSLFQKKVLSPSVDLRQRPGGAITVGTTYRQNVGTSDRPFEVTIEIVAFQRPTVFAFEMARGLNVTKYTWVLQSLSDGTRVTVKLRTKRETWLGKLLRPVMFFAAPHAEISPQMLRQYLEEQCGQQTE